MHCWVFKFTLVLNSILFWKLLAFEILLGTSETLLCSISAPYVKIVPLLDAHKLLNIVCRVVDVFGAKNISLNHIL
jgi:hypothetical protein